MKKIVKNGLVLSTALLLAACGNSSTSTSSDPGVAENTNVKIEVKGGTYVLPTDKSSDSQYLAVELKVTNKTDKKMEISTSDFKFYDEEEDEVSALDTYSYGSDFETLSFDSISGGKSKTTYLIYEIDEDASYSLHYAPFLDENAKELKVTVDAADYEDTTGEIESLVSSYVNAVFLNKETEASSSEKEEKSSSAVLANDVEAAKTEFIADYVKELTDEFYYYVPSEDEAKTFINAYIAENAKRAKVTYTLKTYLPDFAEIYVRPEVIDLSTVDMDSLADKFVEENQGKFENYSDAEKAAEKYVLEQIPTMLNTASIATSGSMYDKEGFLITLTKNSEGEWEINTASDSYYSYLIETFSGLNINY